MTRRMEQVLDMRRQRLSYREIGRALKMHHKSVQETHMRALKYVAELPKDVQAIPGREMRRIEESEYIDGQLRRYHQLYDVCFDEKKYRSAIEALNGAHRYVETLIKLQGLNAPEKHDIRVSVEDLRNELMRIESQVGEITESDVVEYKQIT